MKDVLEEIIINKQAELAEAKRQKRSMKQSLANSTSGIIAEFKRKSPSKGWIHADAKVEDVVPMYAEGGASASSILTDEKYFGGDIEFIRKVRAMVPDLPILRKEFIIDEFQLYEAKAAGADAVLLIAAALTTEQYASLLCKAHELNLEVLLEVHAQEELCYLKAGVPDMLGVNNRSLGTFHTDVQHSFLIAEAMKQAVAGISEADRPLLVSESGISNPEIVKQLRSAGFRGFLIGECFMKEEDPGQALKSFIQALQ